MGAASVVFRGTVLHHKDDCRTLVAAMYVPHVASGALVLAVVTSGLTVAGLAAEPPNHGPIRPDGAWALERSEADDDAWQRVESPVDGPVTALDATSADDLWLAAIQYTTGTAIYRRRAGAWEEKVYYDDRGFDDLQMLSPDEGWFVGF